MASSPLPPYTSLRVTVLSATNLKRADLFGKTDARCEVYLNDVSLGRTSVRKKTLNPTWGGPGDATPNAFDVVLPAHPTPNDSGDDSALLAWFHACKLRVECHDVDALKRGAFHGEVVLGGADLLRLAGPGSESESESESAAKSSGAANSAAGARSGSDSPAPAPLSFELGKKPGVKKKQKYVRGQLRLRLELLRAAPPKKNTGQHRITFNQDTQHIVGMDGHEHGAEMMAMFAVDHAVTSPEGLVCLYFQEKQQMIDAVSWIKAHKDEQLARHVRENCAYPTCAEARRSKGKAAAEAAALAAALGAAEAEALAEEVRLEEEEKTKNEAAERAWRERPQNAFERGNEHAKSTVKASANANVYEASGAAAARTEQTSGGYTHHARLHINTKTPGSAAASGRPPVSPRCNSKPTDKAKPQRGEIHRMLPRGGVQNLPPDTAVHPIRDYMKKSRPRIKRQQSGKSKFVKWSHQRGAMMEHATRRHRSSASPSPSPRAFDTHAVSAVASNLGSTMMETGNEEGAELRPHTSPLRRPLILGLASADDPVVGRSAWGSPQNAWSGALPTEVEQTRSPRKMRMEPPARPQSTTSPSPRHGRIMAQAGMSGSGSASGPRPGSRTRSPRAARARAGGEGRKSRRSPRPRRGTGARGAAQTTLVEASAAIYSHSLRQQVEMNVRRRNMTLRYFERVHVQPRKGRRRCRPKRKAGGAAPESSIDGDGGGDSSLGEWNTGNESDGGLGANGGGSGGGGGGGEGDNGGGEDAAGSNFDSIRLDKGARPVELEEENDGFAGDQAAIWAGHTPPRPAYVSSPPYSPTAAAAFAAAEKVAAVVAETAAAVAEEAAARMTRAATQAATPQDSEDDAEDNDGAVVDTNRINGADFEVAFSPGVEIIKQKKAKAKAKAKGKGKGKAKGKTRKSRKKGPGGGGEMRARGVGSGLMTSGLG